MKRKINNLLIFLINFSIFLLLLFFLNSFLSDLPFLRKVVAEMSFLILNSLKQNVKLEDHTLISFHRNEIIQFEISFDSTGWKGLFLLLALTLSVPFFKISQKIKFLLFGLPAVFLINILRITSTIFIGINFGLKAFNFWHNFLWSYLFLGSILVIWSSWILLSQRKYKVSKQYYK